MAPVCISGLCVGLRLLCCAAATPAARRPPASARLLSTGTAQPPRLLVVGGGGYIGSHVCAAAVREGVEVVSLSRSGKTLSKDAWVSRVTWQQGDALGMSPADWQRVCTPTPSAVVLCVGAFGTHAAMVRACGDTNARAAEACHDLGVLRCVFVSAHMYSSVLAQAALRGYFEGKRRAEEEVFRLYDDNAVVLRPTFVHGTRHVSEGRAIDLGLVGRPLERIMRTRAAASLCAALRHLPLAGGVAELALVPPVSAQAVAHVALLAALDPSLSGVLTVHDIHRLKDEPVVVPPLS